MARSGSEGLKTRWLRGPSPLPVILCNEDARMEVTTAHCKDRPADILENIC